MNRQETMKACYRVPGQTWPSELGWLYDSSRESRTHVEVGTYCGRSLLATGWGMKTGLVVSVDNHLGHPHPEWVDAVLTATLQLLPADVKCELIRSNSVDAARMLFEQKRNFDSVFIDACHEYAECKADIEVWSQLLKPGGLLCGHDYWPAHIGVMDAVNEALAGRFKIASGTRIWYTYL